jgi:hypothetical protein
MIDISMGEKEQILFGVFFVKNNQDHEGTRIKGVYLALNSMVFNYFYHYF